MLIDCSRLYKDKEIKGVFWLSRFFFFSWGVWNLWYYRAGIHQMYSFSGGVALVSANLLWCILAIRCKLKYGNA